MKENTITKIFKYLLIIRIRKGRERKLDNTVEMYGYYNLWNPLFWLWVLVSVVVYMFKGVVSCIVELHEQISEGVYLGREKIKN